MLGERRLAEPDRLLERTDRASAFLQLARNDQPVPVADRLQERLDRFGLGLQLNQIHASQIMIFEYVCQ